MSASTIRTSSTNSAAPTLRPRTRRLISGLDGEDEAGIALEPGTALPDRRASPRPPTYDTRPVSPIPAAHPQRSRPSQLGYRQTDATAQRQGSAGKRKQLDADSSTLAGLWGNSWSTIQGIASDFLGSDLATQSNNGKPRVRRPLSTLERQRSTSNTAWGPSRQSSQARSGGIGGGTREEQTVAFRAQKRKDLLTRQESSYADALGKYKRRLSDDRASVSAPPNNDEDRAALVYLHHVAKDDTLAGITIRYNISAAALRKANRMWPNDTVQTKSTLVLPVDACAVKGKVVPDPGQEIDLLGSESESLATLHAEEVNAPGLAAPEAADPRNRANSASTNTTTSIAQSSSSALTRAWIHDSWVLLPGSMKPTEIVRLPRRAMAYFPPARRKSIPYSDSGTPSVSLDLVRSGTNESHTQSHGTVSPLRSTPPSKARRSRRLSTATNGYFPSYLSGPGGVGTMSKNVHCPGPAQDGLNKMFAKHLPDVAPPKNQNALYQPELPLYTDEPPLTGAGSSTQAYPNAAGGSLNMNIENMGGAIESWVRRLASKAAQFPAERQQAARASVGTPGKGAGGIGDLIEMTNDFEIGGDDDEEDDRRGRQSSTHLDIGGPSNNTATSYFDGGVRGRGKSGKAD